MDLHISAEHVFIACGYTDMRKSIDGFSGRRRPMKSGNSRRSSTAGSWKDSLLDSPGRTKDYAENHPVKQPKPCINTRVSGCFMV